MDLLQKLDETNSLTKEEIVRLLKNMTAEKKEKLFDLALKTRTRYYGNRVFMRGLIEISNYCRRNCLYCGIRGMNANAERYRLSESEILECCQDGYNLGYRTFVLQSGEDMWYTKEILVGLVTRIKQLFPDAAVTLSIGERDIATYDALYKAGADRFLLRHETASRELYEKLHPGMSYDDRMGILRKLKQIGYQVGAGFMVGLPGQKEEHLAEDLLFLKEFQPEMIGIGPFIPHSETPLKEEKGGTVEDTLVLVAFSRLLVPEALIPATTALGTLSPTGREQALMAGANVVMPNLTPTLFREKYDLYENKICTGDEPAHCRSCIERRINSTGSIVDLGRGDNVRFIPEKISPDKMIGCN
ncbi:iron-only hydrogenase maturation protein HydE [Syntrophobotulus glycolicus DSM 8271]|uniref:Iron-only hydrogenase maturation protein HydE n=1 Tax=Syntrophobotulus glycolicus (strain DSM 8271 / FlGlyR) TaxID=645991 RepID=F0T0G0_SYNGF|nr:[FeFe] hydrogenase H-cluster radical SAM maturase HydE [Syntrophobotulus glycolicus]ADY57332.1 iron-only hydrogenase maturation protein HydE [Syntrophobotulus glycolicus DSM 8271]